MTPKQLREALYSIDNQKMTVKEVREMLYGLPEKEYNAEMTIGFGTWIEMEARKKEDDIRSAELLSM